MGRTDLPCKAGWLPVTNSGRTSTGAEPTSDNVAPRTNVHRGDSSPGDRRGRTAQQTRDSLILYSGRKKRTHHSVCFGFLPVHSAHNIHLKSTPVMPLLIWMLVCCMPCLSQESVTLNFRGWICLLNRSVLSIETRSIPKN